MNKQIQLGLVIICNIHTPTCVSTHYLIIRSIVRAHPYTPCTTNIVGTYTLHCIRIALQDNTYYYNHNSVVACLRVISMDALATTFIVCFVFTISSSFNGQCDPYFKSICTAFRNQSLGDDTIAIRGLVEYGPEKPNEYGLGCTELKAVERSSWRIFLHIPPGACTEHEPL